MEYGWCTEGVTYGVHHLPGTLPPAGYTTTCRVLHVLDRVVSVPHVLDRVVSVLHVLETVLHVMEHEPGVSGA